MTCNLKRLFLLLLILRLLLLLLLMMVSQKGVQNRKEKSTPMITKSTTKRPWATNARKAKDNDVDMALLKTATSCMDSGYPDVQDPPLWPASNHHNPPMTPPSKDVHSHMHCQERSKERGEGQKTKNAKAANHQAQEPQRHPWTQLQDGHYTESTRPMWACKDVWQLLTTMMPNMQVYLKWREHSETHL